MEFYPKYSLGQCISFTSRYNDNVHTGTIIEVDRNDSDLTYNVKTDDDTYWINESNIRELLDDRISVVSIERKIDAIIKFFNIPVD